MAKKKKSETGLYQFYFAVENSLSLQVQDRTATCPINLEPKDIERTGRPTYLLVGRYESGHGLEV